MGPSKIAFLIVACLAGCPALAQGGGGGGAGSGAGAAGASPSGASSGTAGAVGTSSGATANSEMQSPTATHPSDNPFKDPLGQGARPTKSNTSQNNQNSTQTETSAPPGSSTAEQAKRNTGAGRSANGLPIGTTGSGPGSPEQPIGR
jgi:hypothetical protein